MRNAKSHKQTWPFAQKQTFHLTRVHHVLISQEMYIDTGNMLAFDVRPVDAAKLKPDTREAHLVEVRRDVP